MEKLKRFFKEEKGLETPEYAVMGALIILAVIVAATALGGKIGATFNTISGKMP
jgi:pilus assembly protein Flp/PilA